MSSWGAFSVARSPGYVDDCLDDSRLEDRSNEAQAQTAIDACASVAMGRGQLPTLPNAEEPEGDRESIPFGRPVASGPHDLWAFCSNCLLHHS